MIYIKFIITGALDPDYYSGHYYNLNGFKFYDKNNNVIVGLNSINNLISQTYDTRNTQSNTDAWFAPVDGDSKVPYNNSSSIASATIIIKLDIDTINKIDLYPYTNNGGGKYVDIYYSKNNDNYKYLEQIIFLNTSTIISTTKKILLCIYLIKQQDKYYSIKSDYYSDSDDKYNSPIIQDLKLDDFNDYGIDDLSSIHSNALLKLIDNKYNIAMLK